MQNIVREERNQRGESNNGFTELSVDSHDVHILIIREGGKLGAGSVNPGIGKDIWKLWSRCTRNPREDNTHQHTPSSMRLGIKGAWFCVGDEAATVAEPQIITHS